MENQSSKEQISIPTQPAVHSATTSPITTVIAVILTVLIAGGLSFFYFSSQIQSLKEELEVAKSKQSSLENDLTTATNEKVFAEKKLCKGQIIDGQCRSNSCIDSDVNEKPDDIYIKGEVTFTDTQGVSNTIPDTCTGSKKQVNEKWCYESPEGSGQYVNGTLVHDCPNGCLDGACIKSATDSASLTE